MDQKNKKKRIKIEKRHLFPKQPSSLEAYRLRSIRVVAVQRRTSWIQLSLKYNVSSALQTEKSVFGMSVLNNRFLLFIYLFFISSVAPRNSRVLVLRIIHSLRSRHHRRNGFAREKCWWKFNVYSFVHLFAYLQTSAFMAHP